MAVKAIIFDFGNIIATFDNMRFIRRVAKFSPYSTKEINEIIYGNGASVPKQYETGAISSKEFFERIQSDCKINMGFEDFFSAYTDIFVPNRSTFSLMRELKSHGFKVGLLSNTSEMDYERGIRGCFRSMGIESIEDYFDSVTLSYKVGAMKPDTRIYQDATSKLAVEASECVYIDDIKEYADAATRFGMNGIYFDGKTDINELVKVLSTR